MSQGTTISTINVKRLPDGMYVVAVIVRERLKDIGPYATIDAALHHAARIIASDLRDSAWQP